MVAQVIQTDYDCLEAIAAEFTRHADCTVVLTFQAEQLRDRLANGGWQGLGAQAFFAEMRELVFPALRRLQDSLQFAGDMTRKIRDVMQVHEEEAEALFRHTPVTRQPAPHKDDDERARLLQEIRRLLIMAFILLQEAPSGRFFDASPDEIYDVISEAARQTHYDRVFPYAAAAFPDLNHLDTLSLEQINRLVAQLQHWLNMLVAMQTAYQLSGQGKFDWWEYVQLSPDELEDKLTGKDTTSPFLDWLSDGFGNLLWVLPEEERRRWWEIFKNNLAPGEQVEFLVALGQMLRFNLDGSFQVQALNFNLSPVAQAWLNSLLPRLRELAQSSGEDEAVRVNMLVRRTQAEFGGSDMVDAVVSAFLAWKVYLSPKGGPVGGGGGSHKGGQKPDIQQINAIANEYGMDRDQRRLFGDHVEELKAMGERGTKNERGDFTYQELRAVAEDWLNTYYPDSE